jgi:hypothetical protein
MIAVDTPSLFMASPLSCHSAKTSHLPNFAIYQISALKARTLSLLVEQGRLLDVFRDFQK